MLLKLLEVLIDSNHEVFHGKGSPQELKARMRQLVQQEYPETEEGIPEIFMVIECKVTEISTNV